MGQNLTDETLRQRVADLERMLKEHEQNDLNQHIQEVTKRLEKIIEMGDDFVTFPFLNKEVFQSFL